MDWQEFSTCFFRLMLKLASGAPVMEDTLMRLLVIGLLRDLPLSAPDAVEIVEQLVCRAASLYYDCETTWQKYPTLQSLMEMVMTNGPARFPQEVIEQLKSLNTSLKLGQMLCRSRNPDFLLRIINRQGTSQSMPWLAELVESSEGSLDVLPVQCLCEFLLHEPSDLFTDGDVEKIFGADRLKLKEKNKKHQQLLARLQDLVHSLSTDSKTVKEVLNYFLQRLSFIQASTRQQAIKIKEPSLQERIHRLVRPCIDYMLTLKFASGNCPSSLDSQNGDKLVHWCHGVPGWVHMFSLAYKIFKDKQYLEAAKDCAEVVWKRGLLRKGYGI